MLVVDASGLYDMLVSKRNGERIRRRLEDDPETAAPHVIDVEVLGVIRRDFLSGRLDRTEASQAVADLKEWGGERFDHRPFLDRAWELRANVRGWDAMYVALAESLNATLITTDARLAHASGPRCRIEVL
jgi:predicted nucleic acid-binding protein